MNSFKFYQILILEMLNFILYHQVQCLMTSCQQRLWRWLLLLARTCHRRRNTHINQQMCN